VLLFLLKLISNWYKSNEFKIELYKTQAGAEGQKDFLQPFVLLSLRKPIFTARQKKLSIHHVKPGANELIWDIGGISVFSP
jgi:hypothetical protein